jgi:large subunit ribosomal protein L30
MPESKKPRAKAKKPSPRLKRVRVVPKVGMISILQVRSGIGCNITHKRVLRSLGLRHPHQTVVRPDNPAVRGMVETIRHLVRIVEGGRA